jgi:enamine deaminase RidA (YjgF/YER057c/UK114 family)
VTRLRCLIPLGAMLAAAPVLAAPQDKVIYSDIPQVKAMQDQIGWADAVVAGDTVYVSGVIAFTAPNDKGMEDAYERAFKRLGKILERAGASWADVVEVRSFHTDVNAQVESMAKVKRRYRPAPDPAWTAVGTSGLLSPTGITEIALVARLAKAKP